MKRSFWVAVTVIATVLCHGICRPQGVGVKNIYPVYRGEKQLRFETPNRYEKSFPKTPYADSVTYLRIDIPYKNDSETKSNSSLQNNGKSVLDYIPVALTFKNTNVKKWPDDQNGIESPEDLSLYNIYTNNISPSNQLQATTSGYDFPHVTHSNPSVLVMEELTTRRHFYDYDRIYTQPIHMISRPVYIQAEYPVYRPPHGGQNYKPGEKYVTSNPVAILPPNVALPVSTRKPFHHTTARPVSTSRKPETTTKNRKQIECPQLSVTVTTFVNSNKYKEGCQDISIHINTTVSNSNLAFLKPAKPVNSPSVIVQADQTSQVGVFGVLWAILSQIFNLPSSLLSAVITPFSSFFGGTLAFLFPLLVPHFLLNSSRRKSRFLLQEKSRGVSYHGRGQRTVTGSRFLSVKFGTNSILHMRIPKRE